MEPSVAPSPAAPARKRKSTNSVANAATRSEKAKASTARGLATKQANKRKQEQAELAERRAKHAAAEADHREALCRQYQFSSLAAVEAAIFRRDVSVPMQQRLVRGGAPPDLAAAVASHMVAHREQRKTHIQFTASCKYTYIGSGCEFECVASGCDMVALLKSCHFVDPKWEIKESPSPFEPRQWSCSFAYVLD